MFLKVVKIELDRYSSTGAHAKKTKPVGRAPAHRASPNIEMVILSLDLNFCYTLIGR